MRVASMMTLAVVLLVRAVFAQEWVEYTNRADRFTIPAPGQPKIETIAWESEYGAKFPGHLYAWQQGGTRYSITVVDYSDAQRIHAALNHLAYSGGPGPGGVYWLVDIAGSVAHAATRYRQKPGVTVTYDAFHYIEFVPGLELQLTNPARRAYAGSICTEPAVHSRATAPGTPHRRSSSSSRSGFSTRRGMP